MCGSKVVDERQEHLSRLYERRVVRKARVTEDDNSHVLAKYELLPSGRQFHVPKSNTVKKKKSFRNKASEIGVSTES